jgi:hypothetical protein
VFTFQVIRKLKLRSPILHVVRIPHRVVEFDLPKLLQQLRPFFVHREAGLCAPPRLLYDGKKKELGSESNEADFEDGITRSSRTRLDKPSTNLPSPNPLRLPYSRLYIIGDTADAFRAIKAGHVAFYQANGEGCHEVD